MFTDQQATVVDKETLTEIVGFVWEMFMGETPPECAPVTHAEGRTATISIGGTWTATLEVTVSTTLAQQFAASLLGMEPGEMEVADIEDALGELANVVGGNVKGLLDESIASTLSLPVVTTTVPSITGGQLTISLGFDCGGEVMNWSLYERP